MPPDSTNSSHDGDSKTPLPKLEKWMAFHTDDARNSLGPCGHIIHDGTTFKPDPNDVRGIDFTTVATQLFNTPNVHRCHSLSFSVIQRIMCEILNSASNTAFKIDRFEDLINTVVTRLQTYMTTRTWPNGEVGITIAKVTKYNRSVTNRSGDLQALLKTALPNNAAIALAADKLLTVLNSSPSNLRYPNLGSAGNNWNMSVGDHFDPEEWCYVKSTNVLSDVTSNALTATTVAGYAKWGAPGAPALTLRAPLSDDAFFLLLAKDHFITDSVRKLWNSLHPTPTPPPPDYIVPPSRSCRTGNPLMASSSNNFTFLKTESTPGAYVYSYDNLGSAGGNWYRIQ